MARLQELTLNRTGSRALLLIAIVAGLIAAVLVFLALQDSDEAATTVSAPPDTVKAVVADRNIAPGTEITADMLKVVDVPSNLLVSGAFTTTTPLVGEVSNVAIAQGEQLTSGKIGLAVPDKGLSGVIPSGMRGVAVQVEEVTAVGGNLLPGDRVDIVVSYRVERGPGITLGEDEYILRTETVIQNAEVISVAQEAQEPAAHSGEEGEASYTSGLVPDDVDNEPGARTLTLALTPQQTLEIVSWQESEATQRVWAVQRPFGDDSPVDLEPIEIVVVE